MEAAADVSDVKTESPKEEDGMETNAAEISVGEDTSLKEENVTSEADTSRENGLSVSLFVHTDEFQDDLDDDLKEAEKKAAEKKAAEKKAAEKENTGVIRVQCISPI